MVDLSIILITWNSERFVVNCLESVLAATNGISREIILVDNGSADATRDLLQPYIRSGQIATFVPRPTNGGVAKARNEGIRKANGRYIWLLDVDTVVNERAVRTLFDWMETNPGCGICGCKLFNSQGNVQDSCRKYPSFRFKLYNVLSSLLAKTGLLDWFKQRIDALNESQFYHTRMAGSQPFQVEYIIGACQLIRAEVIVKTGLLDEHIFYGPEDADFCLRAAKEGWEVHYLPQVSFIHEYQQITNKRLFSRMSWIHTQALFYFFWKHKLL